MNRCLWAERFDGDLADVFDLQDEVVRKIIAALANVLPLGPLPDDAALTRRRATNIEAYDFLVRGRVLVMHSPAGNNLARTLLARAIELDPGLAEAHAYLAISHYGAAINYGEDIEANQAFGLGYARTAVSCSGCSFRGLQGASSGWRWPRPARSAFNSKPPRAPNRVRRSSSTDQMTRLIAAL